MRNSPRSSAFASRCKDEATPSTTTWADATRAPVESTITPRSDPRGFCANAGTDKARDDMRAITLFFNTNIGSLSGRPDASRPHRTRGDGAGIQKPFNSLMYQPPCSQQSCSAQPPSACGDSRLRLSVEGSSTLGPVSQSDHRCGRRSHRCFFNSASKLLSSGPASLAAMFCRT
jgi:hypothetical protein